MSTVITFNHYTLDLYYSITADQIFRKADYKCQTLRSVTDS